MDEGKKVVGFWAPWPQDPTSYYRINGVLPFIHHPDITFRDLSGRQSFDWSTYAGLTHIIIQRPYTESHHEMIKLARDMGIYCISDSDDDLLGVPKENPCYDLYQQTKTSCEDCIKASDEIWVTTPAIKKSYEKLNKNIHVIPNAFNNYLFTEKNKRPYKKNEIAFYRGGLSHESDVKATVMDIARTINGNLNYEYRFIGSRFPELEEMTRHNHTYTSPLTPMQFFKYLNTVNPNIGFYPLAISNFNRSKSNIFMLEATYAGAATFGLHALPEFDHPFVTDITTGMYDPFQTYANDHDYLKKQNQEAWDYIQEERLLSNINKLRINRLLENK